MRSSITISETTTNLIRTMLVVVSLMVGVVSEGRAQSSSQVTAGTVMKPILTVRPVGQPVRLQDGSVEQRYQVIANVSYKLVSTTGNGEEVHCADANQNATLVQYEGRAGYTEVRVRAANEAALTVTAERR